MQLVALLVLTACSLGALQQGLAYDNAFAVWSSGFTAAGAMHSIIPLVRSLHASSGRSPD